MRAAWKTLLVGGLLLAGVGSPRLVDAKDRPAERSATGRPRVDLDRLTLPDTTPNRAALEKHLRKTLHREAKRLDWGGGRENRIEYRFSVTTLEVRRDGDVLRVHCTAVGELPGGRKARSELDFGGSPAERDRLVKNVLDMVARGVVGRLAEMERARRGL